MAQPLSVSPEEVRAYVDYLRDLGIYDLYALGSSSTDDAYAVWVSAQSPPNRPTQSLRAQSANPPAVPQYQAGSSPQTTALSPFERSTQRSSPAARPVNAIGLRPVPTEITIASPFQSAGIPPKPVESAFAETSAHDMVAGEMAPVSFNQLAPLPQARVPVEGKAAALQAVRSDIGDCTRCPLAYAGRHTIVFGDGDANARLLFVGEGPGADEDETGLPFVGKAGQLLNNMIAAMGLKREQVYIANMVKCRPPKNRTPEPVEAGTCSQFLLRQIDIIEPQVIVALGATAATYLLGVKQSLASLRGQWFDVRGAKCAVTYHPAYLLRDPRQKGEAWKDLQRVMVEMKLKPPVRP